VPFTAISTAEVPRTGGVYVVVRTASGPPQFLKTSTGGHFKGKDPKVPEEALKANWVDDAEVVYIGKGDNLRRRLTQYADFGGGKAVGHWGGRLIWQLADSETLLVAWKETPEAIPVDVKTALRAAFKAAHGKPPFANDPQKFGH